MTYILLQYKIRFGRTISSMAKEISIHENIIGCNISAEDLKQHIALLPNPPIQIPDLYYVQNEVRDNMLDNNFSLMEIKQLLKTLRENKAAGADKIPYEFFIHATNDFLTALCNAYPSIFMMMFRSSII